MGANGPDSLSHGTLVEQRSPKSAHNQHGGVVKVHMARNGAPLDLGDGKAL
jgi:hypothetical protein